MKTRPWQTWLLNVFSLTSVVFTKKTVGSASVYVFNFTALVWRVFWGKMRIHFRNVGGTIFLLFPFSFMKWIEKMPKIQIKILIEYRIDISLAYIILISKSFGIVKILDLSQKCWKIMPRFFRQIISTFQRQINNYF